MSRLNVRILWQLGHGPTATHELAGRRFEWVSIPLVAVPTWGLRFPQEGNGRDTYEVLREKEDAIEGVAAEKSGHCAQ